VIKEPIKTVGITSLWPGLNWVPDYNEQNALQFAILISFWQTLVAVLSPSDYTYISMLHFQTIMFLKVLLTYERKYS
jgi:hypothetical protein